MKRTLAITMLFPCIFSIAAGIGHGQSRKAGAAGVNCQIAGHDSQHGIVTERDTSRGRTFQFKADALDIGSLKPGDSVGLEPQNGRVMSIKRVARTYSMFEPAPGAPCCEVTAIMDGIEPHHGLVSAQNNQTSQLIQFTAVGVELNSSLKVGQPVFIEPQNGLAFVQSSVGASQTGGLATYSYPFRDMVSGAIQEKVAPSSQSDRKKPAAATKPTASPASAGSEKKFKAIWEPVNYMEDVEFTDVHFVSADVGWATGFARSDAGEGGFILHTKDGGKKWTVQLGDSHSATRGFANLRFIDATHGWAGQFGEKLVRTTDGETWEEMGRFPTLSSYAFTSESNGVYISGETIHGTQDGGRSWKEIFHCRAKVEVEGLTREEGCHLEGIHFPSSRVGYAISRAMANGASAVVKTEDGGATWKVSSLLPNASAGEDGLFFIDEKNGFVRTYGKLFATADGGETWRGLPASMPGGRPKIKFADSTVGWACLGNDNSTTFSYTSDGGKRWNSREIRFPSGVDAFSLPSRDRGYVVGKHGMVYRYRIVPIDYTSKGMMAAPAMFSAP